MCSISLGIWLGWRRYLWCSPHFLPQSVSLVCHLQHIWCCEETTIPPCWTDLNHHKSSANCGPSSICNQLGHLHQQTGLVACHPSWHCDKCWGLIGRSLYWNMVKGTGVSLLWSTRPARMTIRPPNTMVMPCLASMLNLLMFLSVETATH